MPAAGFTPDLPPDRLERPLPQLPTSVPEQSGVQGAGRPLAARLPRTPLISHLPPLN